MARFFNRFPAAVMPRQPFLREAGRHLSGASNI
jgi:hypothetical protein